MDRKEFLDILSIMNHMAHADGQMHPAEKKVLIAVFKAAKVTPEEQELIRGRSSLEEMIREIKTDDAKTGLVDMMALVAGADGVFEEEEKLLIKKVMKRVGITPEEHTYFQDENNLDIALVRSNAKKILQSITSSS
ncbi:MAG: TerB family tellurite resistance protein [SAR324 cluster bacterium]|nr:TerB family tellurite resistance protein [SAR324 cluster bacterium]MCH2302139.1 TerB family tellurite resistance protein [SAR324 cluster bacterium]MDP6638063.1 TerB family tellurite resistance protein [SAR324 cluster bacterium]MDP6765005.1 TerB family tellurite resistance protein [SAR324 cluster bacterium]|tara:strand:+ start:25 stop:432 length:408 start_codon:yes stop_codon:yes gene_type:complete